MQKRVSSRPKSQMVKAGANGANMLVNNLLANMLVPFTLDFDVKNVGEILARCWPDLILLANNSPTLYCMTSNPDMVCRLFLIERDLTSYQDVLAKCWRRQRKRDQHVGQHFGEILVPFALALTALLLFSLRLSCSSS